MKRVLVLALTMAAAFPAASLVHAQTSPARTLSTDAKPKPAPAEPAKRAAPAAAPKTDAKPAPKAAPDKPKRQASAAETIDIAGDTSKGYGRLLFQWSGPVGYDASIADGILIIKFARPFRLPPDKTSLPLDGYVARVKQDGDLRTLRVSLAAKVRLHTSSHGRFVAIDLVPTSFKGDPDDVVDPAVKPVLPKGVADVKMTIGVHEDKTRLVFDWGEKVSYEAKVEDGKIRASFAREGKVEVARLNNNPPAWVRGARVSAGDNKTLLEIDIDPGSPVEQFALKNKVVFDVKAPRNDADAEIAIVVPEEMQPKAAPKAGEDEHKADEHGKPDDAHHEDAPKEGAPEAAKPDATAHAEPEPKAGAKEKHGEDKHAEEKHAEAKPAEPKEAHAEDPHGGKAEAGDAHAEAPKPADAHGTPAKDAHAEDAHEADPHAKDGHGEDAHAEAVADHGPAPSFKAERTRNELVLTLPASASRGAAMFRSGDRIFIVYEGNGAVDVEAVTKSAKDFVGKASVAKQRNATVLTLDLVKPLAVTAQVKEGGWVATVSADPIEPPRPVVLLRDERVAGEPRVRATLDRATAVVELTDPATGDRLMVALASGSPQGFITARRYVQFAALASAQGIAVQALADDVTMALGEHDVVISARDGLILSAGTVSDYAPTREGIADDLRPAAMDFKAWAGEEDFLKERSRLLVEAGATGDDKDATEEARLALARFYLAHDLGAEAMGQLQLIVRADETVVSDPAFRALRAAALLLLDRPDAATEDLRSSSLDDDPNAQLLRGLAAAGRRDWSAARDSIVRGESAIGDYREDWQARFRIAGARGAVETNAADTAERMLKAMPKAGVPRRLLLEADLVRGRLAEILKQDPEAKRLYSAVRNGNYRPLAIRAALAEIMLRERTHDLSADTAIEEMEALRWQWRGDDVELDLLHKLGTLHVLKSDYKNGLLTMRSAVLGFPNTEEARAISAEMGVLFEDLFLRGKADTLPAVQALGLYYDFRELTPIGVQGDEMVRRLADRLIAVDLLDQAAELLQHQVDKRLDGVAKAQIAAKLAAVYLMAREPEKALRAIRASAQTRLPEDLAAQRRLLSGRALSDLKQYEAALESFEQDETPEAVRLRADILWASSDWAKAAAGIELLIAGRETSAKALDAVERTDILRAAIAYTMAEDNKGLASLRERFLALMADVPEAAAFAVVTRAVDPSGVAFRDLAKAVAGVDTLDIFLQSLGLGKPAEGTAAK